MKVTKNGRVKLDSRDTRVGNFVVTDEPEHIKIQDINSTYHIRISKRMPVGIWLTALLERGESALPTLKTYIAVVWSMLSVAPDDDFVQDIIKATEAALKRHPDWYGIKADATDEEHAEAAREVREMKEFEEEVKKLDDAEKQESKG